MSLLHQIALTKIKGIGPVLARNLLSYFGNAEAVFAASKKELAAVPGIGNRLLKAIGESNALTEAETELRFAAQHNIRILFQDHPDYPRRLTNCFDAPLLLYYKGTADLNSTRMVSVVGTRSATAYGKSICAELMENLVPYHVVVVSGLAYGIDSHAHRNALKHNIPTIGVMGHGLDRIYPASNRDLATRMLECGGLLTEFPSGTAPDRQNFPMRNRIIAGLADVTVVVEAASRGGALITAELANNYNRDVCAFPGNIHQEFSAGCNYLIKTHRAHLVSQVKDLEYLMNWVIEAEQPTSGQLTLPLALSANEQKVYDLIAGLGEVGIDELAHRLSWPQSKLAVTLLQLEMSGSILALPGKVYRSV